MARTKQVGILWRKQKDKKTYFTGFLNLGVLGDVPIGIFPFDEKKTDKSPDYAVVLLQARRAEPDTSTADDDIPLP